MGKVLLIRIGITILVVLIFVVLFVLVSYVNHYIHLRKEDSLFVPMGQLVKVNGHHISVYIDGSGEQTLVFMSGGATSSPILDFKSLYSLLCDQYKIVVVERAGHGFSDDCNTSRDIDTVLSETREALTLAGVVGPYVLCPHSIAGIEAIYWARQYPDEVKAIIGLDMALPASYKEIKEPLWLYKYLSLAVDVGILRFMPNLAENEAIKHGALTEQEKMLYRVILNRRTLTKAMMNEAITIQRSAEIVERGTRINKKMLLFVSDGSGGAGYDKETWRGFAKDFAEDALNTSIIMLDCPHYVHDYEYYRIAKEMREFLVSSI